MLDYWSRIILATIMGIGVGLALSHFLGLGNHLVWVIGCVGVALATETSLRTIKNVGPPPNPILDQSPPKHFRSAKIPRGKPPKPNF